MKQYAAHLMKVGANVLRGYDAYIYEFSKVRQVSLLRRLALRYPRARVINHASQAPSTAEWQTFLVILPDLDVVGIPAGHPLMLRGDCLAGPGGRAGWVRGGDGWHLL